MYQSALQQVINKKNKQKQLKTAKSIQKKWDKKIKIRFLKKYKRLALSNLQLKTPKLKVIHFHLVSYSGLSFSVTRILPFR